MSTTVVDSSIAKGPFATRLETLIKTTVQTLIAKATEIDKKFDVVSKVSEIAKQIDTKYGVTPFVTTKAEELNKKYGLKEKAVAYAEKTLAYAKDIDAKYHVLEKADSWKTYILSY